MGSYLAMISKSEKSLKHEVKNHTGLSSRSGALASILMQLRKIGMTVGAYAYTQQGYDLNQERLDRALAKTGSCHIPVNFRDTETAAKTINDQVEKDTNNRIKNLVQPSEIDPDTVLGLLNTLHLKGNWNEAYRFKDSDREFKIRGTKKTVQGFWAAEAPIFSMKIGKGLLFALSSGEFDFVVKYFPDGTLSQITAGELDSLYRNGKEIDTNFWMPNGAINSTLDLKSMLREKLPHLLTEKFSTNVFGSKLLEVYLFKQMARVMWNSVGFEAAAATVMLCRNKCMRRPHYEQTIHVEGPFTFEIVRRDPRMSLFSGQVASWDSLSLKK